MFSGTDEDEALVSETLDCDDEAVGFVSYEEVTLLSAVVLLDSGVVLLLLLDDWLTDDTTLVCLGATWPPSCVPVATFTTMFPALTATISDTIAAGVKNGGVRYFFDIIPPRYFMKHR